jgi:putative membrane protein
MTRVFGLVALVLLVIVGLSFAALNSEPVTLNYYLGFVELPLSLIIVATLAFGALLGVLASLVVILRYRTRASLLKRRLGHLEADLHRHKLPARSV